MSELDPEVEEPQRELMDLRQALQGLTPICEALISVAENFQEIEEISSAAEASQQRLADAREELAQVEYAKGEAEAAAEHAKTSTIEAQAQCDSMIAGAREVAAKIIDDAKHQALAEVEATKADASNSLSLLTQERGKAQAELADLQAQIKEARATHDQVLASMGSLSKRLGAA